MNFNKLKGKERREEQKKTFHMIIKIQCTINAVHVKIYSVKKWEFRFHVCYVHDLIDSINTRYSCFYLIENEYRKLLLYCTFFYDVIKKSLTRHFDFYFTILTWRILRWEYDKDIINERMHGKKWNDEPPYRWNIFANTQVLTLENGK